MEGRLQNTMQKAITDDKSSNKKCDSDDYYPKYSFNSDFHYKKQKKRLKKFNLL